MKQRVVIANKFYYKRGGDCIYSMNLEKMLSEHGHEVAFFAMDYPENETSSWSRYFPSEVKFKPGAGMIEAFRRPLGTHEVIKKFSALLDDFKPDVVHLNNIHTQLSPVIARIAHGRGIKVVWTLHDFKLLCPRYDCLRGGETTCHECFDDKRNVRRHKCMKGSTVASYLAYLEAKKWNRGLLEEITDTFICPSDFIKRLMMKGGFSETKLHHLSNSINVDKFDKPVMSRGDYYCYLGRLSEEKGVGYLIEAANRLPYNLKIIGDGPLAASLREKANGNIDFVGYKQWDEIKDIVGHARFAVIPSVWYENNPLSVIEAFCLGTPVLGSNIGGIPELIKEDTGRLSEPRDVESIEKGIAEMWTIDWNYKQISAEALARFNDECYYNNLMRLY